MKPIQVHQPYSPFSDLGSWQEVYWQLQEQLLSLLLPLPSSWLLPQQQPFAEPAKLAAEAFVLVVEPVEAASGLASVGFASDSGVSAPSLAAFSAAELGGPAAMQEIMSNSGVL